MLENVRFQSTRPRGARPYTGKTKDALKMFQSTRPRGARQRLFQCSIRAYRVSIHAPAWGATKTRLGGRIWVRSFNPRARVGRDFGKIEIIVIRNMFQSTRPRGARRK